MMGTKVVCGKCMEVAMETWLQYYGEEILPVGTFIRVHFETEREVEGSPNEFLWCSVLEETEEDILKCKLDNTPRIATEFQEGEVVFVPKESILQHVLPMQPFASSDEEMATRIETVHRHD